VHTIARPRTGDRQAPRSRRPRRVYGIGDEPDPRFVLANERTLLAWLRTALAFVVMGIGAVALHDVARPAGGILVAAGAAASSLAVILAPAAYLRWGRVERALRLGRPLPAPRLAVVLVGVLAVLAIAALTAPIGHVR
jgi:putative membrane protein